MGGCNIDEEVERRLEDIESAGWDETLRKRKSEHKTSYRNDWDQRNRCDGATMAQQQRRAEQIENQRRYRRLPSVPLAT